MGAFKLIRQFEASTSLPVDLNEVARWIRANVEVDVIRFIGVTLTTDHLRGYLVKYRDSNGGWDIEAPVIAKIYYDTAQGPQWVHLVCGKELLHILDSEQVRTQEQFELLTERLTLPNEVRHLLKDPDYAATDKAGVTMACALLLPMGARETLLPAYKAGQITAGEIARQAAIPVQYVRLVMSDPWPMIYDIIAKLYEK